MGKTFGNESYFHTSKTANEEARPTQLIAWLTNLISLRFFQRIKTLTLSAIVLQQLTISVRHYIKPHPPNEMVTFSIHYLFYFIYLFFEKKVHVFRTKGILVAMH